MLKHTDFVKLKLLWECQYKEFKTTLNLFFLQQLKVKDKSQAYILDELQDKSQAYLLDEYAFYTGLLESINFKIKAMLTIENLTVQEKNEVLVCLAKQEKVLKMILFFRDEFFHCVLPSAEFFEEIIVAELEQFDLLEMESLKETFNEDFLDFIQNLFF